MSDVCGRCDCGRTEDQHSTDVTDAVSPKGEDESKSRKKEEKPSPPDATNQNHLMEGKI